MLLLLALIDPLLSTSLVMSLLVVDFIVIKLLEDWPKVYVLTWYFFLNSSKLNTLGYEGLYTCPL